MPYITQERKDKIKPLIDNILQNVTVEKYTIGDINYIITMIIKNYINSKGVNYSVLNESIGVLECAKMELYRRLVSVYEDKKIKDNGDVYNKS